MALFIASASPSFEMLAHLWDAPLGVVREVPHSREELHAARNSRMAGVADAFHAIEEGEEARQEEREERGGDQ